MEEIGFNIILIYSKYSSVMELDFKCIWKTQQQRLFVVMLFFKQISSKLKNTQKNLDRLIAEGQVYSDS